MKKLNSYLSYIPASESPLSADIVVILGKENVWLYDVGADLEKLKELDNIPYSIALSHFHPDHIANLNQVQCLNLYQGENTFKYTHFGNVVKDDLYLEDGFIHLFPIPSTHAKGCMGLEVNQEFVFVGDSLGPGHKKGQHVYNANLVKEQIEILKKLKAKYICQSHHSDFIQNKDEVIQRLEKIYQFRDPQNPYIYIK